MQLKKTNLGKWRFETQTYFEHTETVWVFRQLFLVPFFKYLSRICSSEALREIQDELLYILRLETIYHDYDKLYVPENRLKDMLKFDWHANLTAAENEPAVEALLSDLEISGKSEWDTSIIDKSLLKPLLQNANVCHNGSFPLEKWKLARQTYERLFREKFDEVFESDVLEKLTNLLAYSIRVADAVASATDENAAFKTDVSKFTEFLRVEMPNAKIVITAIHLNTTFNESTSASVLQGYYTLYDAIYRAFAEALQAEGVLILDNLNVIVGITISEDAPSEFEKRVLNKIFDLLPGANGAASIFQVKHTIVDCLANVKNYDELLKRQLVEAIYDHWLPDVSENGFPCSSCGRNVVVKGVDSNNLSPTLKDEISSLESRGDFGNLRTIGKDVFQTPSLDKGHKFICDDCCTLSAFAGDKHFGKTTVAISNVSHHYEPVGISLGLTNDKTSELPKLIYGFKFKQKLIESINQNLPLSGCSCQLVAKSFVILEYTTTAEKMFSSFVDPLCTILQRQVTELPDGKVIYSANFGIRIGTGTMLFDNHIIDNEFLKGVLLFAEYHRRFKIAAELDTLIRHIGSQEKENGLLLNLMNVSGLPSLTRRIMEVDLNFGSNQREHPKLSLTRLLEIADFVQAETNSVQWLRTIRQAEKIK